MQTPGIDHIILTISDYEQARGFYSDLLGFDVKALPGDIGLFSSGLFFDAGNVHVFLLKHQQTEPDDRFNEFRIGLDHLAFTAPSEDYLHQLVGKLNNARVENSGVATFALTGNLYVALRDPDNIQLEYWLPKVGE